MAQQQRHGILDTDSPADGFTDRDPYVKGH